MGRSDGLARHCCACYIPLLIWLKSEGWRPKSHLFPRTWISIIVPLALKAPLWLKLMLPLPKVLVQPQISGRVFVGSFPPYGHPRAEDSCSPQGPGPRLPFLAEHVVAVGRGQCGHRFICEGEGGIFSWDVLHCLLEPVHCTKTLQAFLGLGSSGVKPAG